VDPANRSNLRRSLVIRSPVLPAVNNQQPISPAGAINATQSAPEPFLLNNIV
jgi:hypothetical protein